MECLWTSSLVTQRMGRTGREGAGASGSQAGGVTGMAGPVDMRVGGGSVYLGGGRALWARARPRKEVSMNLASGFTCGSYCRLVGW